MNKKFTQARLLASLTLISAVLTLLSGCGSHKKEIVPPANTAYYTGPMKKR